MLSKNKISKKLKNYIKEHLSKGYSKHAVRHILVSHGYDEAYVNGLLRKHSELQFVKKYALIASFLFVILVFSFNMVPTSQKENTQKSEIFGTQEIQEIFSGITGYAISASDEGCCTAVCQQTAKQECYGNFIANKKCDELQQCTVGCCMDREGYCLTNYLYDNCLGYKGTIIYRDCSEIIFCRNLTGESYLSRRYGIKQGLGVAEVSPVAGYYGSSFSIKFYIYDNTDILSIAADIKDSSIVFDSITLYDDGSHNDGVNNDNIYGNNWPSSKMKAFDGFKKLEIDIIIKHKNGTQQSIKNAKSMVVLNNNKCLPISDWGNPDQRYSLIFAAQNYENLSNGYEKFQTDVQTFLNIIFSIGDFSKNRDNFNIYRLEQSLSYLNIPTLMAVVSSSCPSYSNKKDLVVVMDNSEEYCITESPNVVRTNPSVLFYRNVTNAGINNTFADFCGYALTPKKLADEIIKFSMPPKITIHTSDSINYTTSSINFSFSVSASNYPVNYSVFLEDSLILNKISPNEVTENFILNLANGTNVVLISASDKNKNFAFSQVLLNTTLQ